MSTKALWMAALLLVGVGGCGQSMTAAERLVDDAAVKISQGNRSDAEPALKQAIEKDPNLAWAHYNLASCLLARRAFDDAVAEYRRALDLFGQRHRPARSAALYGIALALDDKNEFAGATRAYQAYLEYAGPAPEDAASATLARSRLNVLSDATLRGLPSGKPLRAPIGAPAPASAPAAAPPPPPPPPAVVAPEPAPAPVAAAPEPAPAKAPKGKAAKGKRARGKQK